MGKKLSQGEVLRLGVPASVPDDLRPSGWTDSLYWELRLFSNARDMRKSVNRYKGVGNGDDYAAIVCPLPTIGFREGEAPRLLDCLGRVYFTTERLDPVVIGHEAIHMATSTLRSLLLLSDKPERFLQLDEDIDDTEEALAYLHGQFFYSICESLLSGAALKPQFSKLVKEQLS